MMLLRMLRSLKSSARRTRSVPGDETPLQRVNRLNRVHAAAPVDFHLELAYGALRIGDKPLVPLVERCVTDSYVATPPAKTFHRPLASYFLARYFLHSMGVPGARAECGVYSGTSALLLCCAAQTRDPLYTGAGLHLIDSFEGLAEPTDEDRYDAPGGRRKLTMDKGGLAAPIERAKHAVQGFPQVAFHQGWIPAVFDTLPETPWSFVHLDVDHYEPTYHSLAYFYPRLSPGGVIVCDDYGAPLFPGAHRAWDRYCDENAVPYVVLDTGQSVILARHET